MNVKEQFEKIIKKGVSVSSIARAIGCHPSTLSKWYHGHTEISEKLCARLKEYIEVFNNE